MSGSPALNLVWLPGWEPGAEAGSF